LEVLTMTVSMPSAASSLSDSTISSVDFCGSSPKIAVLAISL
jgi:hypothetical protein